MILLPKQFKAAAYFTVLAAVTGSALFAQTAADAKNSLKDLVQRSIDSPEPVSIPLGRGRIEIPRSSIRRTSDVGVNAHTNIIVHITPDSAAPGTGWETPASIACIYKVVPQVTGCPIATTTQVPSGGSGAIAIVDAYHYPTAANDLAVFSAQFGLPAADLTVVYANGSKPAQDSTGGWELEAALDLQWAHAMAPNAKLYLVEAASASLTNLLKAETVAANLVAAAGGGQVSNSWGSSEFSTETSYDSYFVKSGVTFFASTGDTAFEKSWPAMSPNVVAVGGTTVQRSSSGAFTGEIYWDNSSGGGGGGISSYEARPSYQSGVSSIVGAHRGVPDISAVADPVTGVAIYDSTAYEGTIYGWLRIGGTSASAPILAARANLAGLTSSSSALLTNVYTDYGNASLYATYYRDVTLSQSACKTGWDTCTGVGVPLTNSWH